MKNKFLIIFITFFLATFLRAEDLFIEAKDITLNKDKKTTIFKNSVSVKTKDKIISSEFAEFDKKAQTIVLKEDIIAKDKFKNTIKANYAEYDNIKKIFKSDGPTTLITSENYILEGVDIIFDNFNKDIKSNKSSTLKDLDGNEIYLENFEYLAEENIFKSIGLIKIKDKFNNIYEFSQIYIDTKKKEVLGTDIKAFLNSDDFKINKENDPRIFANTIKLSDEKSTFDKSIFTICGQKENEKCPPWTLQASKMTHEKKNKTIYYNNAVIKIYDFPIFYLPYLSHPDPTVSRRSGFLPPSFSDSKNLGANLSIPYFWAINEDKNFTISNNLFYDQHPLFIGEYNQAFKNSNFLTDFGFTEGYKKTSASKKSNQLIWKKKIFYHKTSNDEDIHATIDDLSKSKDVINHNIRFIIVTDFINLLSLDLKTRDTLDIDITEIDKNGHFFLPLIGQEKYLPEKESEADIKAAYKMGKLYDNIISNNKGYIAKDFPSNENILLEKGDTTAMGNYFVLYKSDSLIGINKTYEVEYFNLKKDGTFEYQFTLNPFIQLNEIMGNVAEPSTQHFLLYDVYSHLTYADVDEHDINDPYHQESIINIKQGDTLTYDKHFIFLDSLMVNANTNPESQKALDVMLIAKIKMQNMLGEFSYADAIYAVKNNIAQSFPAFLEDGDLKYKFMFSEVNAEAGSIKIKAYEHIDNEKPFIIMKAIIFPYINLLWIGAILMAVGTLISVIQLFKKVKS